jgi:hypothetical protein
MSFLSGFSNFCGRLTAATLGLVSAAIAVVGFAAGLYTGGATFPIMVLGMYGAAAAFNYAFRPLDDAGPKESREDSQTFEQGHSKLDDDDSASEFRDDEDDYDEEDELLKAQQKTSPLSQSQSVNPVTHTAVDTQRAAQVAPVIDPSVIVRPTPALHHAIIQPTINFLADDNMKKMQGTLKEYTVTDSPKPADNAKDKTAPFKSVETDHGNFKIYKDKLTTDSNSVEIFTDMLRSFDAANKGKTPRITASPDPKVAKNLEAACIAVYGPEYLKKVTIVPAIPVIAPAARSATATPKTAPEPERTVSPAMGRKGSF